LPSLITLRTMFIVSLKRRREAAVQRCGIEVSAGALGCATMKSFSDEPDRDVAIDALRLAREIGIDFLDSSNAYGRGGDEELEGHRHEYVIASKFGNLRASDRSPALRVLGRCIRHCDGFEL
jgi:aryl-alcohol dehydrogenase-like predicted oxidoreductase